jgi:hypothetical protein
MSAADGLHAERRRCLAACPKKFSVCSAAAPADKVMQLAFSKLIQKRKAYTATYTREEVYVFAVASHQFRRRSQHNSFQNNVPDPVTSGKELPTFKFELEKSEGRVMGGSYGKEATVAQLPISKGIAGVSMRMEPGVMRELHWHATAAEWAFVTEGRVRTTVIDPPGLLRDQ